MWEVLKTTQVTPKKFQYFEKDILHVRQYEKNSCMYWIFEPPILAPSLKIKINIPFHP